MTLCTGQLHPITVYRTSIWVCIVLVLSVTMCSFYQFLDSVLFHLDICDYHWAFYGHSLYFDVHLKIFCTK